jgi:hypothetical protein
LQPLHQGEGTMRACPAIAEAKKEADRARADGETAAVRKAPGEA